LVCGPAWQKVIALARGLAKEACKSAQIWQAADNEDDGVLERHSKVNRVERVEHRGGVDGAAQASIVPSISGLSDE
jgi:hypothetical protein